MPAVTLQVMRAVEHPVNNSGIMIADSAAWCEHAAAGYVFTDPETVRRLALRLIPFVPKLPRWRSIALSEDDRNMGRLA